MVSSEKTKTKTATIAIPTRIPRTIPRARSPLRHVNAVEQAPVGLVGALGRRDHAVGVLVGCEVFDQLAHLRGMLDVAALVDAEVGGARALGEAVALDQARALRTRDRWL